MSATSSIRILFLLALLIASLKPAHAADMHAMSAVTDGFAAGLEILCDDPRSEAQAPDGIGISPAMAR